MPQLAMITGTFPSYKGRVKYTDHQNARCKFARFPVPVLYITLSTTRSNCLVAFLSRENHRVTSVRFSDVPVILLDLRQACA